MKHLFTRLACMAAIICGLMCTGCEADVDLGNIDATTAVKASLAFPIGSIRAEIGDFIGDTTLENITIKDGNYVYCDTFISHKSFHEIDLSSYVTDCQSSLSIRQQLIAQHPELAILPTITIPADSSFHMDFVMPFVFKGLNNAMENQRVDSIIVKLASFVSTISVEGLHTLTWDEITGIELMLDEANFRRDDMSVDIPINGYNFDKPININVDNFHMILMKDIYAEPSSLNITDSTAFTLRFHFKTKRQHQVTAETALAYNLQLNLLDYAAIFGYFKPSNLMRDAQEDVPLTRYWKDWGVLDGFMLPVREPRAVVGVEHALAMPLEVTLNYMTVKDKQGNEKPVTFNGQYSTVEKFPAKIQVTDPLDARASYEFALDYTPENGNLEEVMKIHPDFVSYDFNLYIDPSNTEMKQFRMTDDTDIQLSVAAEVPFKFNPGTYLFHGDTLKDIEISQLDLDSLVANIDIIDTIKEANVSLFIGLENAIPFAVKAKLELLDEANQVIEFEELEEIELIYPKVENLVVVEPAKYNMEISVGRDELSKLSKIKAVKYHVTLGENTDAVDLNTDAALKIYLGVKADTDMVLDLNTLFGENTVELL